jgi:mono/diheme cytochrome c family protein
MNSITLRIFSLLALLIGFSTAGWAQAKRVDLGKKEYDANCAACHGTNGKGRGPYREYLKVAPADLTMLAKKNNGVFPINRVYEVIDGREAIAAHGPREMPVWGTDYSIKAAEYYLDILYDPEAYVRNRILSLVDYLYRIQQK